MNETQDRLVQRFRAFLVFSGVFNITLAAPLMVPELFRSYLALLWRLNGALSLGGEEPAVPSGVAALLANTAGIDLVLIGVIVLWAAQDPRARWFVPAANAVGRAVFAVVVAYHVVVHDVARILLVIGMVDVVIAAVMVGALWRLRPRAGSPQGSGVHRQPG